MRYDIHADLLCFIHLFNFTPTQSHLRLQIMSVVHKCTFCTTWTCVIFGQKFLTLPIYDFTDFQPAFTGNLTFVDLWRSLKVIIFMITVIYSSIQFEWYPYWYHSDNIQIWPIFKPEVLTFVDLWRSFKVIICMIIVIYSSLRVKWYPYWYHSDNFQIWPIFKPEVLTFGDLWRSF